MKKEQIAIAAITLGVVGFIIYIFMDEVKNENYTSLPSVTYPKVTDVSTTTVENVKLGNLNTDLHLDRNGRVVANTDDWNIFPRELFSYEGLDTIAVSGADATKYFQEGDKLRIGQGTDKYLRVMSVDSDSIVLNATDSYRLTDETITSVSRSRLENPTGWSEDSEWTYLSPSAFAYTSGVVLRAIDTNDTQYFNIGTKVRVKQGGAYAYFYVINVNNGYITLTAGDDYELIDTALEQIGVSELPNPSGHPSVFNYTGTITSQSSAFTVSDAGTYTGSFYIIGENIYFNAQRIDYQITGVADYFVQESLPVPIDSYIFTTAIGYSVTDNYYAVTIKYPNLGGPAPENTIDIFRTPFAVYRLDENLRHYFQVSYKIAHD